MWEELENTAKAVHTNLVRDSSLVAFSIRNPIGRTKAGKTRPQILVLSIGSKRVVELGWTREQKLKVQFDRTLAKVMLTPVPSVHATVKHWTLKALRDSKTFILYLPLLPEGSVPSAPALVVGAEILKPAQTPDLKCLVLQLPQGTLGRPVTELKAVR